MTAEHGRRASAVPDRVRTITVRGVSARVSLRPGVGRYVNEPPLLLCNGIGASFEVLQPFVDALDPHRGVIRFDVPGIGGSSLPPYPYTVAGLASWVTAVTAALGYPKVDVLGLSWGGGLAQQLALQSPKRIRRVVLAATGTGWLMRPANWAVLAKLSTPQRYRAADYAAAIAGEIYGGSMRTNPERGAALLHSATRAGPRRGYYYQLLAMAGWTSVPFLRLLRQPTLVLGGTDDPIIPVFNPRLQARMIPRARLHLYDGGHLGIVTEAHELAPVVESFLDEELTGGTPRNVPAGSFSMRGVR